MKSVYFFILLISNKNIMIHLFRINREIDHSSSLTFDSTCNFVPNFVSAHFVPISYGYAYNIFWVKIKRYLFIIVFVDNYNSILK